MHKIDDQIKEYLNYCEKVRGMSPVTMRAKRNILERFITVTKLGSLQDLTNEVFNFWVADLTERGVSPRSINTYNAALMAMVHYYRGIGIHIPLQTSLVGKLREGTVRRQFYTYTEIKRAAEFANYETRLMIKIMYETGMRIAELTNLAVSNFTGRRIQFVGKGRKPREVYIHEDTLREVHALLRVRGITSGYIFATLNGEPPTVATIRKRLRVPFKMAGIEGFYPHALRHSFATSLQLKGASIAEIKEMMGHESIATTERYLHGFEGKMQELFDKYG